VNLHGLADYRGLLLHRAIAEELTRDLSIVRRAKENVERLFAKGLLHEDYRRAWSALLDADVETVARAITEESERANELRQVTPFTFVIEPRARWALWARAREEWLQRT
jgi:hypothetical protein